MTAPTLGPFQPVSNSDGELLFYTNGCEVLNRNHAVMLNGHDLNPGEIHTRYCDQLEWGYPSNQGNLIFPGFNNDDVSYFLFHLRINEHTLYADTLYYTQIDMAADNGSGAVVKKNAFVFRDTLQMLLTAVKHANGRDWWLVVPRAIEPYGIHTFLFSPTGVKHISFQPVPQLYDKTNGQACFSPDGRKYCINQGLFIYTFDFDRCTGVFSNDQRWRSPIDNSVPFTAGGVAVSPNSEILYIGAGATLYQYDMNAANIEVTGIPIAEKSNQGETFVQMALAPNDKIYCMDFGYSNKLHVIQNPNIRGVQCQAEVYGFEIPTRQRIYLPHFPNYRLYDEVGSACDTICANNPNLGNPYSKSKIEIFPNPVKHVLKFKLPFCPCGEWQIYNVEGRPIHSLLANSQDGETYEIDVSSWSSGVYFIRGKNASNRYFIERFAVIN
ncbi:MAG: T9SS type A sorting domain-containing protein [Lewinellaceae bacterium]|nr:T9SS type A sorting domain-containing protein [Lewinellaceae bacterium]